MIAVNGRFLGLHVTGIERYAREVLRLLPPTEVRVIGPPARSAGSAGYIWEQTTLPRGLRRGEILWCPTHSGPLAVRRQVLTLHDAAVFDHPEWFSPRVRLTYKSLVARVARRAVQVTTSSEFSRDRLASCLRLDPSRIAVIPGGVSQDPRSFVTGRAQADATAPEDPRGSPARRRLSKLSPSLEGPYVLAVSTIDPRKNLERLLSAWAVVSKRREDVTLALVGASSSLFSRVSLEQAPERVSFLGYVNDCDLRALYAHCQLFVYPSVYEGFGLPPLEAMAAGAPVVASDIPALTETLAGAARFVDPYDISSIAEGILSVLDDAGLRSNLVAMGARRVSHYSWQRTADAFMDLLRSARDELNG